MAVGATRTAGALAWLAAAVAAQDPVVGKLWPIQDRATTDPCIDSAVSGLFGADQCPVDCKRH